MFPNEEDQDKIFLKENLSTNKALIVFKILKIATDIKM